MRLAATEYQRCADLLRSLDSRGWAAPTACPAWDVRQMAAHMLGMAEMAASIREGSRQRRAATVNGNVDVDRLTALQVSERSGWSGPAISDRFAARAPKAVTGRRMTPGFIRRRTMIGGVINGVEEPWTLGYLIDVILTRDPWMHRLDICTALDRTPHLTADHDGVIVVGARCAGSPTAMLLARQGYRVLLVDRATFPSDTISTHVIHPTGIAALNRWGLLDQLLSTGCPPVGTYAFDFGPFTIAGSPGTDDSPVAYAPRRTVLDKLLVDAAASAGPRSAMDSPAVRLLRVLERPADGRPIRGPHHRAGHL